MIKIYLSIVAILFAATIFGQHTLQLRVVDAVSKKPLSFASISPKGVPQSIVADSMGFAQLKISSGKTTILISHIAYEEKSVDVIMPLDSILIIELSPS